MFQCAERLNANHIQGLGQMNTYLVCYCDGKYNGCVVEMEPEYEESRGDSKAQVP